MPVILGNPASTVKPAFDVVGVTILAYSLPNINKVRRWLNSIGRAIDGVGSRCVKMNTVFCTFIFRVTRICRTNSSSA
nr:MAG TPA: hypothetical protein [Caudoviricetes sp.]